MAQHILSEVGSKGKVGGSLHWVVKVSGGSPHFTARKCKAT